MNVIAFSAIHIRDQAHADALSDDLWDWKRRCEHAFDRPPDMFLVERGTESFSMLSLPVILAGIPDSKPYHCKDWSYGVAAGQAGLSHAMRCPFDLVACVCHDAILGVSLRDICREFMERPEVICGPAWHGSIDSHLVLMKREAVIDTLYSLPFMPLARIGSNAMYYEHALTALFIARWWNPWPEIETIRMEINTPELFKGTLEDIIKWPLLSKADPATMKAYRLAHPLPLT